ncbi:uncharacterized protein LOC119605831 [Lucilia sericata]|uniref:uncharacterized protein LOC119605831 n=1 Tax=Lucilia sericata TaxID=13632 RepID=UPI0018A87016|nr:uncharacterized protein LOC119605831 [Lucilia sericata]
MSSSITSKSSNFTGHTSGTFATPTRKQLQPLTSNDIASNELALENFINSLELSTFFQLPEDEQKLRLDKLDVLELYQAAQNINREFGMIKLENFFLIDFLEKNDPKLLIGLEQRRATAQTAAQINVLKTGAKRTSNISVGGGVSGTGGGSGSLVGFKAKSVLSKSLMSVLTTGSLKKTHEYKLNFRAKTDMAEKLANEVEKRVQEMEKNASQEIKLLRGHMAEMHFQHIETQETAKNFELHFLRDESDLAFLSNATEKQLEHKFRKFVNNWIKTARALLATMRLKITALQEHCQQLRNELLTKADLSGILTAIDFEKLIIKRTELLNALEEKNSHMAGLKGVTGKASLSMAEEKQIMMNIEEESKQLNNKTLEVVKTIAKLEKEAEIVEAENEKDVATLENLRLQLERYEAPSINEYVQKKEEVLALEKEEKMLRRKIYILNMKLDNTQKKCKRQMDSSIFINIVED